MHEVLAQAAIRPRVPGDRVPGPKPDEVVAVAVEEVEVRREVERFGRIAAPHVDQVVPHVRANQQDRAAVGVAEVARIPRVHSQRSGTGSCGLLWRRRPPLCKVR